VEFVLRFTFSHPDMDTTIVDTIYPAHLQSNIDALQKGPLWPSTQRPSGASQTRALSRKQLRAA